MKRLVIIVLGLFLSISFCVAQNLRDEMEQQRQREIQQQQAAEEQRRREAQAAEEQRRREAQQRQEAEEQRLREEQQRQEAEAQRLRELEILYQNTIASAERNFEQRQFTQARQEFVTALELKPENAATINARIAEIDRRMSEPATLHLYRKRSSVIDILSVPLTRYDILLGNTVVGRRTTNNWKTTVTVTSLGAQTLSATIDGRNAEIQIIFEPGGVYYVSGDVSSVRRESGRTNRDGSPIMETLYTPTFQLVDGNVGASEFNSIVVR